MGYRSDVYIAVKKTDYENLIEKVNSPEFETVLNDEKHVDEIRSLLRCAEVTENCFSNPDYIEICFDSVKWYDDYYEVEFVHRWLEEIEKYDMIIFGEEFDDNTFIYNSDFYLFDAIRGVARN